MESFVTTVLPASLRLLTDDDEDGMSSDLNEKPTSLLFKLLAMFQNDS